MEIRTILRLANFDVDCNSDVVAFGIITYQEDGGRTMEKASHKRVADLLQRAVYVEDTKDEPVFFELPDDALVYEIMEVDR